jgi:type IV pilus assembly protein PilO
MEGLAGPLNRIPIMFIAILVCGYLSYDYWSWTTSPQSELGQKKASFEAAKNDLVNLKKKLAAGEEFYKNLEPLRARIVTLTQQLESTRTTLSADIDIANFVRMINLEAKKLGVVIRGIRPEGDRKKDYFIEVPFSVSLRGAYVQILVFFDRIAKFQQVIRIDDFEMKPSGNTFTKYVELEGKVKLLAYKYLGTKADEIAQKSAANKSTANETPAQPAASQQKGKQ